MLRDIRRDRAVACSLVAGAVLLVGCAAAHDPPDWPTSYSGNGKTGHTPEPDPTAKKLPELRSDATLSELLGYAALNNPELEARFNRWKGALERVPQVEALPDPRFTYRYFIEEVETRVGAQRQSFGIAQTFPWFGKLNLRGDAAAAAANAEYQRHEATKLKLFYEVAQAYCEHYYLGRAIAVTKENIKLLTQIEAVARARYRVAGASHPDVIRAQVELGKLDDHLRSLRELRAPVVAALNAVLNRPPDAPLDIPTELRQESVSVADEQLLVMLAQRNPDLKTLDSEISRQKVRIDLAKQDYFPDVTLGVDYIDTAASVGGRHPSDDGKDPLVAMVSVTLPIWWNRIAAGVREARYDYLSALHQKVQKANALNQRLKMVLYRFRDAGRRIDLYRDTLLPKARESLRVTEASFRTGTGSFIDLLDAQRILLEFELAYERALTDHVQRLAELDMLVGSPLPRAAASDGSVKD